MVKDEIFQTDPLPNSEMKSAAAFIVSILLLAFCQSASAQPAQCPICRFEYRYGHCSETGINNPPKDSIAFTGTVTAAEPIDCGVRITVDVKRSSARSLPAKIAIDVLPCSFWNGAIGDGISAAGAIAHFHCGFNCLISQPGSSTAGYAKSNIALPLWSPQEKSVPGC